MLWNDDKQWRKARGTEGEYMTKTKKKKKRKKKMNLNLASSSHIPPPPTTRSLHYHARILFFQFSYLYSLENLIYMVHVHLVLRNNNSYFEYGLKILLKIHVNNMNN